ncbi:MAG: hypothetical protein RMY29_034220 [Nostoc sp. CreGUA01]
MGRGGGGGEVGKKQFFFPPIPPSSSHAPCPMPYLTNFSPTFKAVADAEESWC